MCNAEKTKEKAIQLCCKESKSQTRASNLSIADMVKLCHKSFMELELLTKTMVFFSYFLSFFQLQVSLKLWGIKKSTTIIMLIFTDF